MDQNVNDKIETREKITLFYNENKSRIFIFFSVLAILLFSFLYLEKRSETKNLLVSEKYIQAGIYLSSGDTEDSKIILEQIIQSKNSFYSTLALNMILEKELEKDSNKILKYFEVVEDTIKNRDQKDLVTFKKALYLMKISRTQEGKKLLNKLVESDSRLKKLATDIIYK